MNQHLTEANERKETSAKLITSLASAVICSWEERLWNVKQLSVQKKERERNKMDYSASVVLPWHMASILWVLSAASWEDGLTYGSRDVFWRQFIKCKSERPATMNYGVILRSARGADLQEWGGTLGNLPLQRWGPRSQRWTERLSIKLWCHPEMAGVLDETGSEPGAAMQKRSSFWSARPACLNYNRSAAKDCDGFWMHPKNSEWSRTGCVVGVR